TPVPHGGSIALFPVEIASMAKRIQFSAHGGPEVLEYVDYTPAEPGPHEVRVRNRAIGLNFIDTYFRSGLYVPPALPSGLGTEGAGEVEAVGSAVTGLQVGDRVAYATGPLGAYSELHVDRKSTRLNSSHVKISYAVFCLKKKNNRA